MFQTLGSTRDEHLTRFEQVGPAAPALGDNATQMESNMSRFEKNTPQFAGMSRVQHINSSLSTNHAKNDGPRNDHMRTVCHLVECVEFERHLARGLLGSDDGNLGTWLSA